MKLARSAAPLTVLVTWLCAAAHSQTTTLVSIGSDGLPANSGTWYPSLSADGRFVAFSSDATNLASNLPRESVLRTYHVFLRDRETNETTQVDVDSNGAPSAGSSYPSRTAISSDGRFVAFDGDANGLVPEDANGFSDVFVHDRSTGQTTRVDIDSFGAAANRVSYFASISGDGRFVAFTSEASNLVPGDTNGVADVFVHDRATRRTIRVSVDSNGAQGNLQSRGPAISADGRSVAFESYASNLVQGDTNGLPDIFVHDLTTARTECVSVSSSGSHSTIGWDTEVGSISAAISSDGRFVAFMSDSGGIDHSNFFTFIGGIRGFFAHDRVTGATTRASVNSAGFPALGSSIYPFDHPSISADGRYVAFASRDQGLVSDDFNLIFDVFVHDFRSGDTTLQSRNSAGAVGNALAVDPALSGDGRFIVFRSTATNLVDEPTGGMPEVFARGRLGRDLIETYCYGDSTTSTLCPCLNAGTARRGCANSQVSEGAKLFGSGRPSTNTVVLTASSMPASSLTIFLQGSSNDPAGSVFGDGVRCAAGTLTRLYTGTAVNGSASAPGIGEPAIPERSALLGDPIAPGDTRYYQAYYRDPDLSFCTGSGFNVTNAVLIGW